MVKQEISLGVTTHKLKQFVQEKMGKKIDSQDIHNIKHKMKVENGANRPEGDLLLDKLKEISEKHSDMCLHVDVDETNHLSILLLQSN